MSDDWRFYALVSIISSGVWSIFAKVASTRIGSPTLTLVAVSSAWLVTAIGTIRSFEWSSTSGIAIAAAGGVAGGLSSIAFYNAIRLGPASIVLPSNSLYLVVTVTLSYFVLGETVTLRQFAGIVLALAAIVLLAK